MNYYIFKAWFSDGDDMLLIVDATDRKEAEEWITKTGIVVCMHYIGESDAVHYAA